MERTSPVLCLASASPRRRELLAQIGVIFTVADSQIDESVRPGEQAAEYVGRLAREKAVRLRNSGKLAPVLAADTAIELDGCIYGKPRDRADAIEMLGRLSGRTHTVLTAIALADSLGIAERLSLSRVSFRTISERERTAYWHTGEPRDKAGGYAIQGLGAVFVQSLQGSYSGVMGLPLFETAELLHSRAIADWRGAQS